MHNCAFVPCFMPTIHTRTCIHLTNYVCRVYCVVKHKWNQKYNVVWPKWILSKTNLANSFLSYLLVCCWCYFCKWNPCCIEAGSKQYEMNMKINALCKNIRMKLKLNIHAQSFCSNFLGNDFPVIIFFHAYQ